MGDHGGHRQGAFGDPPADQEDAVAEQVALGRRLGGKCFHRARNLSFSRKAVRQALTRLGEKSVDNVLARVGRGEISVSDLVEAVYPGASFDVEAEIRAPGIEPFRPRLAIQGLPPGAPVAMGQCCTPVPGERIVGIRADNDNIWCIQSIAKALLWKTRRRSDGSI